MRWSYKTIHFEMKKDGILGSAFLDESEIEETLNEYGHAGWELISLIEVRDGVIAVFKQPLGVVAARRPAVPRVEEASESEPEETVEQQAPLQISNRSLTDSVESARPTRPKPPVVSAPAPSDEDDVVPRGVGMIRIE